MTIKYVSLNSWYGGKLFDEMVAFLEQENPDIIALQEVYDGKDSTLPRNYRCFDELLSILPLKYGHFAPAFNDHRADGVIVQGNAILSRWPITSSKVVFYDEPYDPQYTEIEERFPFTPRNLEIVDIQLPGTTITVANTQGIWGLDGGDSPRRLAMSEMILAELQAKSNVILSGDFNIKPDTQTIRNLEQHYTNVFKDELISTFNMKHKENPGYATAVVDMAFVSPSFTVKEHYCSDADVSDHLPLVFSVELE